MKALPARLKQRAGSAFGIAAATAADAPDAAARIIFCSVSGISKACKVKMAERKGFEPLERG